MSDKLICESCGKELDDSGCTAYKLNRDTVTPVCSMCKGAIEQYDLDLMVKEAVNGLCNAVNGRVGVRKLADALCQAVTREHRYLQNELFMAFHHMFEQYAKTDYYDGRNEWAVRAAGNWQKHSFDQKD